MPCAKSVLGMLSFNLVKSDCVINESTTVLKNHKGSVAGMEGHEHTGVNYAYPILQGRQEDCSIGNRLGHHARRVQTRRNG